jgi:hypothetical protein
MDFFSGFEKIRYYIMIVATLLTGYVWATFSGTKVMGDDNQVKEERSNPGESNFYHK